MRAVHRSWGREGSSGRGGSDGLSPTTYREPDFVRHCEATPDFEVRSREDFKDFLRSNTESFPDNVQTFRQVVVEGDRAGIWCTYEGTQNGPLGPFPPSGRTTTFDFGGVFRIRDGRFAELWVTWDNMTILAQLGHLPAPEPAG